MKKILLLMAIILSVSFITGCDGFAPKKLSDEDVYQMMKDKKTFILEVTKEGCTACEDFAPTWKKILTENKIKSYSIDLAKLSEEDSKKFGLEMGVTGTPTVIFIKDGEEETLLNRIVGSADKEAVIKKLEINDYIKTKK